MTKKGDSRRKRQASSKASYQREVKKARNRMLAAGVAGQVGVSTTAAIYKLPRNSRAVGFTARGKKGGLARIPRAGRESQRAANSVRGISREVNIPFGRRGAKGVLVYSPRKIGLALAVGGTLGAIAYGEGKSRTTRKLEKQRIKKVGRRQTITDNVTIYNKGKKASPNQKALINKATTVRTARDRSEAAKKAARKRRRNKGKFA